MQDDSFPSPDRSLLTGFAVNRLNRLSERRGDRQFIEGLKGAPSARSLVLSGDIPVLKRAKNSFDAHFTFIEAESLGTVRETAFLGMDGEDPLFATLIEAETPENAQGRDDIAMIDLRSIATQGLVPAETLGVLGQAKSLMYWHTRHRFCSNCGAPSIVLAAGWRRECPACKASHFPRIDPVVIMLVHEGEECLLGRQAGFPAGMYSCLAGFVESGETCEDAVRREVFEEAGIGVGRVDYLASQPWPFPASLMIGCIAVAASHALTVDHRELEDARWFSREEVKLMLAKSHPAGLTCPPKLAIANLLIRAWALNEFGP
ncbi:MAG TPA: NAD(+) diphosphatase [Beijerinckia sp.]|jgi:NAD+ diphosphatase|nr:NAD(+) diphosphatase [Beijerinckia sp.]